MSGRFISAIAFALAAVASLAGCTGLRVTSDVNPDVNVSVCATYAWAGEFRDNAGHSSTIANPLIESRLRAAIAANLKARGVEPAPAGGEAACLVGYGIGRRTTVEGSYAYGPGWGWPGPYGWGWDAPYVYQRGLIAVNLYQAKGRLPLWHAVVEQDLSGFTGRDAETKINDAVAALFTKYPH